MSTLSARSFKIVIALTAYFDLKIKYFDVINIFINALKDINKKVVYYKFLEGFEQLGNVLRVDRVLYGIRDSLYL